MAITQSLCGLGLGSQACASTIWPGPILGQGSGGGGPEGSSVLAACPGGLWSSESEVAPPSLQDGSGRCVIPSLLRDSLAADSGRRRGSLGPKEAPPRLGSREAEGPGSATGCTNTITGDLMWADGFVGDVIGLTQACTQDLLKLAASGLLCQSIFLMLFCLFKH